MTGPAFALEAATPVSRCLVSFDAADRSLTLRSGQILTLVRITGGEIKDASGAVGRVGHSAPRWGMLEDATAGVWDRCALELGNGVTNLLLRSEELDNASWTKTNVTISTNAIASPSTALTADKLAENTATGVHGIEQAVTISAGQYVTVQTFVKAAERTRVTLRAINGSDILAARMQLDTGTTVDASGGAATYRGSGIEAIGNGWYRVWVTGRVNAGSTAITVQAWLTNGTSTSYTGTSGSGLHLWGLQCAVGTTTGAIPPSYVPTAGATASVNRDQLTGAALWATAGRLPNALTVYAKVGRPRFAGHAGSLGSTPVIVTIGNARPRLALYFDANNRNLNAQTSDASTDQAIAAAIPAGRTIEACAQFVDLLTAGKVRLDVGSGFGSYSATVAAITGLSTTDLCLGDAFYSLGNALEAPLVALKIAAGQRTLAEMRSLS